MDEKHAFLNGKKYLPYSSWASSLETRAWLHNTNATADLSTCNGTCAIFGQHKACPDRDDMNRRSLSQFPPFPVCRLCAHFSSHFSSPMTLHSHTPVTMPSYYSNLPQSSPNIRHRFSLWSSWFVIMLNICLFGDDLALSAVLATDDSREQNHLDRQVHYFDHDLWQQEHEHISLPGQILTKRRDASCPRAH